MANDHKTHHNAQEPHHLGLNLGIICGAELVAAGVIGGAGIAVFLLVSYIRRRAR